MQTFNDAFTLMSAGAASFAYNAFGGVETHTETGNNIDYNYDPFGRISQIVQNSQVMAQFGYDGNGSVVERTIDGQSYDYTIDPFTGATISEDLGGVVTNYDLDPGGEVVASIDPSDVIYYHFGADGNTYALTTAQVDPQVAGSATYGTGGETLASTGQMPNQPYQSGGSSGHHTVHQEPELVFVQIGGGGAHGSGGGRYYVTRRPPPPGYRTIQPYRPLRAIHFPTWFNGDPCGEAPGDGGDWWYDIIVPSPFQTGVAAVVSAFTDMASVGSVLNPGTWDGGRWRNQPGFVTSKIFANVGLAAGTAAWSLAASSRWGLATEGIGIRRWAHIQAQMLERKITQRMFEVAMQKGTLVYSPVKGQFYKILASQRKYIVIPLDEFGYPQTIWWGKLPIGVEL